MICCPHAISEGGHLVLGAQAGEARLAHVFRKAGLTHFRRAAETPFNEIFQAQRRARPLVSGALRGSAHVPIWPCRPEFGNAI